MCYFVSLNTSDTGHSLPFLISKSWQYESVSSSS